MTSRSLFVKSDFVKTPLFNGIGRYICQLQRITLKFCKEQADSKGLRDFIEHDVVDFAKKNPGVVVYLKPRRHRAPVVKAEYLNGGEEILRVKCMDRDEIVRWVYLLRTYSGQPVVRLRKMQHTDFPSIQGVWTPWTNAPPQENLENFPSEKYGAIEHEISATEYIRQMFQRQKEQETTPGNTSEEIVGLHTTPHSQH